MEKISNQTETLTKKTPVKLTFKEQFEKEQRDLKEAAVAFDIDDFTQGADTIRTVFVPNIGVGGKGRNIKFKRYNAEDVKELEPYINESNYDQGLHALALMMFKADGKTTFEKLKKIPVDDANAILQAISAVQKYFQPPQSSTVV